MDLLSFWVVIFALILFIGYAYLIRFYKKGWDDCPLYESDENFRPSKKVTVIIPARNEEKNIQACLTSLQKQTYPSLLLEVLVVDDHSEDGTAEVVRNFPMSNLHLIPLKDFLGSNINAYKKKAIEVGIGQATGEWIVTTDADCTAGPDWIREIMSYHEKTNAVIVAGPVKLTPRDNFLEAFQTLDFLTLQGITAAAVHRKLHTMCNGANLAYSKEAFHAVNGFQEIDGIASGDDMLLMQKVRTKFPDGIAYIKSQHAIVATQPAHSWRGFWNQRIRWSSKADRYQDKKIFRILLLVYFFNLALLLLFIMTPWNFDAFIVAILLVLCKTVVEYPFTNSVAKFFGQARLMAAFLFLQPFHLFYVVVAGFLGKFGKYQWKGRTVK